MDHDPLALDAETMRRIGYQTVDWLVDRAVRRDAEPVLVEGSAEELAAQIPADPPRKGSSSSRS